MVRGIQIYFPLSLYFIVGMLCPSIEIELRHRHKLFHSQSSSKQKNTPTISFDPVALKQLITGIDTGEAVQQKSENITFYNSLQVSFSERFVFSSDGDFSLVEQMLHEHQEFVRGPRMIVD